MQARKRTKDKAWMAIKFMNILEILGDFEVRPNNNL